MNKSFLYYVVALLLSVCANSFGFTKNVTNNLNSRYESNAHSYVLPAIPNGTAVTIDEDCNCSWGIVGYNGYFGYVSTKYLSKNPVSHKFKPNLSRRNITFGKQKYQTAGGNITEGTTINLKEVKLGSLHLNNIKASVVRNQAAALLLGQSVLCKLGQIEIDKTKKVLRITYKQKIK